MSEARLKIDLAALARNYAKFKAHTRGAVGAVVKANAYGLGALPTVACLLDQGCEHFFVATEREAAELNQLPIKNGFVLMPSITHQDGKEVFGDGWIPVINSMEQARAWRESYKGAVAVHIDTGMLRLGIAVTELDTSVFDRWDICLLMTHLACGDTPDHPLNQKQLALFERVKQQFSGVPVSIGNSAGSLMGEEFHGDITRPGIGLYGGNPFSQTPNPMDVVATLTAQVVQVRHAKRGETIGYGATHVLPRNSRVAVLGIGYADGLKRILSDVGHVAFQGIALPIIGRVSMDMVHVDATDCNELDVGDEVEIFGDTITLEEIAENANSINYEILTSVGSRVERVYV